MHFLVSVQQWFNEISMLLYYLIKYIFRKEDKQQVISGDVLVGLCWMRDECGLLPLFFI